MWYEQKRRIKAFLASLCCFSLVTLAVGCTQNQRNFASWGDKSPVANESEKTGFLSRLASLRKKETSEEEDLARNRSQIFNSKENPFLVRENEIRAKKASSTTAVDSKTKKSPFGLLSSLSRDKKTGLDSYLDQTPNQKEVSTKRLPFEQAATVQKKLDTTKFMSIDQFIANVDAPLPPTQKTPFVKTVSVSTERPQLLIPNDDIESSVKKSTNSQSLFVDNASLKKQKPKETTSAIDPAFAKFQPKSTKAESGKNETPVPNPTVAVKKPIVKSPAVKKPTASSFVLNLNDAPAKAKKPAQEKTQKKVAAKSPSVPKKPIDALREQLDSKPTAAETTIVAQHRKQLQSSIQRLLNSSQAMLNEGQLSGAKQFATEAKLLAEQGKIKFGPYDIKPEGLFQKIQAKEEALAKIKQPAIKTPFVASKKEASQKQKTKPSVKKTKEYRLDELPVIVSSPRAAYRANAGSGFQIAAVRANSPVSLAEFITEIPEGNPKAKPLKSKNERPAADPVFNFDEPETDEGTASRVRANRDLILKSPSFSPGKLSDLPSKENRNNEAKQKSFLPRSITIASPISDDAPLPIEPKRRHFSATNLPEIPMPGELETEPMTSDNPDSHFSESLFDGSRGPVMPMLFSFLSGAILIAMVLFFRRR